MKKTLALLSLAAVCSTGTAIAQNKKDDNHGHIKRVLLISIDGMHAVDFANCANGISTINGGTPYCPALASLSKTGVNYVAASTSKPSDFPGLTALSPVEARPSPVFITTSLIPGIILPCENHRQRRGRGSLHTFRGANGHQNRV